MGDPPRPTAVTQIDPRRSSYRFGKREKNRLLLPQDWRAQTHTKQILKSELVAASHSTDHDDVSVASAVLEAGEASARNSVWSGLKGNPAFGTEGMVQVAAHYTEN